jgi:hypothetical protein
MAGTDPMAYLEKVSFSLPSLTTNAQIMPVLDELENLYKVLDPELRHLADQLIETLRGRLTPESDNLH